MSNATTIMIKIWMGWIPNDTGNSFLSTKIKADHTDKAFLHTYTTGGFSSKGSSVI
jgi:hypothetical protein